MQIWLLLYFIEIQSQPISINRQQEERMKSMKEKNKRNNSCARIFVQIQNNSIFYSRFCGEKVTEKEGAGHESNAGT